MKAILLLGSNMNNPEDQLETAIKHIAKLVKSYKLSSIYKTQAWGKTDQADFLNIAMLVEVTIEPFELMKSLLEIEQLMGRKREHKWDARIIDIDIITIEDKILNEDNLKVPHPFLQERMFVLIPLKELNPEWVHPGFNKSINKLIEECTDELKVERLYS